MEYVISILINGLQLLAIIGFFDTCFTRKYPKTTFWKIACGWFLVECAVLNLEGSILSPVKALLVPVLFLVLNFVLYQGRLFFRIFISIAIYAIFSAFAYAMEFAVMSALSLQREEFVYNKVLYTITSLIGTVCMLLFAKLAKHFYSSKHGSDQDRNWTLVTTIFPIASVLIVLLLYTVISGQKLQGAFAVFSLCIVAAANIIVLLLIEQLKRSTQEHEMLVAISERERQQQESVVALSAAYGTQRKLTHDFRKHLSVLEELLQTNQIAEATRYVAQLQEEHTERILLVNTHNATIDAILNQKGYKAQKHHIEMRFEVNDLSGIHIHPADCTVVLGNLLDNAIDACQKLPEEKRWIQVSVVHNPLPENQVGSVFISVLNPSLPVKIVNQDIATTKPDASFHGFGLRNVKTILEKYGAEYDMFYEDGKFAFSLDWPDCTP